MQQPWSWVQANILPELSGPIRTMSHHDAQQQDWWRRYLARIDQNSSFHRELQRLLKDPLAVCRIHGDLSPHNMMVAGDQVWLFDWEEYSDSAPCRTDEIRFELALRMKQILTNPRQHARAFTEQYGQNRDLRWRDAMLALAFLHGARVVEATALIEHWDDC